MDIFVKDFFAFELHVIPQKYARLSTAQNIYSILSYINKTDVTNRSVAYNLRASPLTIPLV